MWAGSRLDLGSLGDPVPAGVARRPGLTFPPPSRRLWAVPTVRQACLWPVHGLDSVLAAKPPLHFSSNPCGVRDQSFLKFVPSSSDQGRLSPLKDTYQQLP